jgi:hypothetical protein
MSNSQRGKKNPPKRRSANAAIKTNASLVLFTVTFYNGAGGIYFHGEGIPDGQYINSGMTDKTIFAKQTVGHQIVTVAGSAPAGGKITVMVSQGSKVLSAAGDNVFDKLTFSGFIVYEC